MRKPQQRTTKFSLPREDKPDGGIDSQEVMRIIKDVILGA